LRQVGTGILVNPRHGRDDDLLGHKGASPERLALKFERAFAFSWRETLY
jgi:hypothetical protein